MEGKHNITGYKDLSQHILNKSHEKTRLIVL